MAAIQYDQPNFTSGELDPRTYARVDYSGYAKGAKTLRNAVIIPQGGFQNRFGLDYVDTVTTTNPDYVEITTLLYNDNLIYVLLWEATTIKIYLENILIATVTGTEYQAEDIRQMKFTQVQNDVVVAHPNYKPTRLVRSANSANVISGVNAVQNYITLTDAVTPGLVLPITFTTGGSLPTTSPQIYENRTYFAYVVDANNIEVYASAELAKSRTGKFTISAAGSGTSNVLFQNTWVLSDINFIYYPSYNFGLDYSSLTFTPSVTDGAVTITASGAIFTAAHVGGVFQGNGGSVRITAFTDSTHVTGFTVTDFANTDPIKGSLCHLGQPAWDNTHGWPRAVGFFQQRLFFGGTLSIPNGVWGSVINEVNNFDDSESLDDNAISYYGANSGLGNYVKSFTSAESLLVHTNTGTYSPALGSTVPATPDNFYLVEQNKDGVSDIQPVNIDNQVIYVDRSNNNVKNLQYDIIQSKYVLNNISVPSSHLIVRPTDMAAYADPEFTDGSYVFVVNSDGTLAILQTLIEQNITGWTLTTTKTAFGQSNFVRVASGINQTWFLVQRMINGAQVIYIEELDFTIRNDCSKVFSGLSGNTITGLSYLEGETVDVTSNDFYLGTFTVSSGTVTLPVGTVAGSGVVGLSYTPIFEPLPVFVALNNGSNFYQKRHVRRFYVYYYQTCAALVNTTLIPTVDMRHWVLGQPLLPVNGVYESTPMGDWDAFDIYADTLTISSPQPFPMTIIGIGYILDV